MEQILLNYLKSNKGNWFKKVQLYVLADEYGYSPETCGRILRDLAESGRIKVDYYDGLHAKNLAKYAYNPIISKPKIELKEINGVMKAIMYETKT